MCGDLKRDILEIIRDQHAMPQESVDWVDEVRPPLLAVY